ncbi:hypothetical protein SUGI_1178990 [Cryptomeria japonica]|nr:hypothetical protein SUGI_1178990 [Cryptomeria japonica]
MEMKASENKGEFNHDTVQAHFGEGGLVQEVPNSKYAKPAEPSTTEISKEPRASGAEVQQNRVSVGLDMLPAEEAKDGVTSLSQQEIIGAKDIGSVNLNGCVMEQCTSKPTHLENSSNKSCLDAEEASVPSAEDGASTGIQSSPKIREKDTKAGVSESAEYMECAGAITRGNSDAHGCEWMSIAHISKVTDGHISKESELGLDASTGPLHGHEVTTRSPSAELKVPVNIDSGSPKQKDGDLPITCQTEEKDKRTEPCQKKGTRLTDSGSINTSRSSINTNLSDHQPSIIPVKVVDESMDWKGLIKPTSECGVAGDCDTINNNLASEVSGASYSAGNQEDTGTSDGNETFRDNIARGIRISDESDSKINMEKTSTGPDEKDSELFMETGADTDLHFLDDALEVARQVGKEAEQEVESYDEPLCSSSYEKHGKGAPVHSATTESVGGEQDIFHEQNEADASYSSKEVNLKVQCGKDGDKSQGNHASGEIDESGAKANVVIHEVQTCKIALTSQESITHETDVKVTSSSDQIKMPVKCIFDLNEDVPAEDMEYSQELIQAPTASASNCTITNVSTPIPIVPSSKGPLNLPTTPLHFRGELGWRGSAATSAFRPAEPRRTPERDRTQSAEENNSPLKPGQRFLEFDLNVADDDGDAGMGLFPGRHDGERHVPASTSLPSGDSSVEVSSSRKAERLTLDLNRLCETDDSVPGLLSDWRGVERLGALQNPNQSPSPTSSSRPAMRDFDLNDNLSFDDACASAHDSEQKKYSMKSNNNPSGLDDPVVSILGSRINLDPSKLPPTHAASWDIPHVKKEFPNSAQSFLVSGPSPVPSFNNMGRILPMPYQTQSLPFPYNGVALGSSFPIPSAVYAPGPVPYIVDSMGASIPQIVAPGAISSYTRPPYMMGVPGGVGTSNAGGMVRPNLDLNAESDSREGGKIRQLFPQSNHMLVEEQIRPYQQVTASGTPLKRKESERAWDSYQLGYKQVTTWP